MHIERYIERSMGANCYLLIDDDQCIIIDPCVDLSNIITKNNLHLKGIFITHGHFDHITNLSTYLNNYDVNFYFHKNVIDMLKDPKKNCSVYTSFSKSWEIVNERIKVVHDKDQLDILSSPITIFETGGHTSCSICILVEDMMFSGDTIFKGTVGRTDLYSSNTSKMIDSIHRLKNLKENYRIYPGHGPDTTLDEERIENPYFKR